MFKAIKDNKIIDMNETGLFPCMDLDSIVEDKEHTVDDYEKIGGYGEYVLKEEYPVDVRNEQIRQERQNRYIVESDPLRLDYDEALAREQDNAEQLKQEWLASKDKIREELPYIGEQDAVEEG